VSHAGAFATSLANDVKCVFVILLDMSKQGVMEECLTYKTQ